MFWNEKAYISQKVYENSKLVIYFTRLAGYFPLTVEHVNSKLFLKWSPFYALYSFILGGVLFFLCFWELWTVFLANKNYPMTPTGKITMVFAHGGWAVVYLLGFFVTHKKLLTFLEYMKLINRIDTIIKTDHSKSEKYLSVLILAIAPISVIFYALNSYVGYISGGLTLKAYINNNLAYYSMLALATINFYNVRHMVYSLKRRLSRLNQLLEEKNVHLKSRNNRFTEVVKIFVPQFEAEKKVICGYNNWTNKKSSRIPDSKKIQATPKLHDLDISQLNKVYLELCEAAALLNQLFSGTFGIGIMIASLQVVQPTYFFISGVKKGDKKAVNDLRAAFLALFRNFVCVLLPIESTYACSLQIKSVEKLVCSMFCWNLDRKNRFQAKHFALCLGLRKIEFSPWGLFTVDRCLFAEMIGTTVRFLFLLLQMQEGEHT